MNDFVIESVPLAGLGAQGFGRWLDEWRELEVQGYDVTVLVPLNTHREPRAVGLALRVDR